VPENEGDVLHVLSQENIQMRKVLEDTDRYSPKRFSAN
jgi:hypothetical protein